MPAEGAKSRVSLPNWPRLMKADQAAAYLSIGASTLRERGPKPKQLGRAILYDRHDLDRWADALDGQPLDAPAREAEGRDMEERIKARLRARS